MKNIITFLPTVVAYFFILLFCYAGFSKIWDFENFQIQIAQSPLLSAYAAIVPYGIIIIELFISLLLIFPKTRIFGLYLSLGIMISFTLYIYLILNFSDFIPCSCGGILEKLNWPQHLIFNAFCVFIALVSLIVAENGKKTFVSLSLRLVYVVVVSCCLILIMFFSSEQLMKTNNQFIRRFPHHPIMEDATLDLGANSYYFAGVGNGKIILGNYTSPLTITIIDDSFTKFYQYRVELDNYDIDFTSPKLYAKDSYIYLTDGRVPIMYKSLIKDRLLTTFGYNKVYFDKIAIGDSLNIVFGTLNPQTMVRTLGNYNIRSSEHKLNNQIITKQVDGLFDTDGQLFSDNSTDDIYYIYYYRNKIIKLDKFATFVSEQNTIDTTSVAKIQTGKMSNGKVKMVTPPFTVNKMATACNGLVFNQSNLMGRFENRDQWKSNSIIDIYNTKNKSYKGSFYVQNKGSYKMSQMLATSKYFYTLIGNEIIRYRYAQTISDDFSKGKAENLKPE